MAEGRFTVHAEQVSLCSYVHNDMSHDNEFKLCPYNATVVLALIMELGTERRLRCTCSQKP